jgi:hypothetical protein
MMTDRNTKGQFIKGHSESEELRRKNSATSAGKHYSPVTEFRVGEHGHPETEFKKGNHPKSEFKRGRRESEEVKERRIRHIFTNARMKPNKKEKDLDSVLQELFPGEYSLNVRGDVLIIGGKVPDFVNTNGQKKLIGALWRLLALCRVHSENGPQSFRSRQKGIL